MATPEEIRYQQQLAAYHQATLSDSLGGKWVALQGVQVLDADADLSASRGRVGDSCLIQYIQRPVKGPNILVA